jgi:hypothetical protein
MGHITILDVDVNRLLEKVEMVKKVIKVVV